MALKDYPTVVKCTQKLLDQNPNELFAFIFLGRAQALNGDLTQAKATFSRGFSVAQQAQDEEHSTKVTKTLLTICFSHCKIVKARGILKAMSLIASETFCIANHWKLSLKLGVLCNIRINQITFIIQCDMKN